jgi:hypothetical protein
MSDYSWPADEITSGTNDPENWAAACKALPIGSQVIGTVIGRQPFGVFLEIVGTPKAIGLAEISAMPANLDLPAIGAQISGEVIWHAEHNHQVKIRIFQSTDDQKWAEIDPLILACTNIHAIRLIREIFSCAIHPAVDLLDERHTLLRHIRPEDFAPPESLC